MFANKVLMVRPVDFAFNCQTGVDNEFQRHMPLTPDEVRERSLAEFDSAVAKIEANNIDVLVLEKGDDDPKTPDAVFPNNWFATDGEGNIHVFAMKAVNRQWEVRVNDVKTLLLQQGLKVGEIIEVNHNDEKAAQILEGTGAIVFDHQCKIAYAALSERCHLSLLQAYCEQIGYQPLSFSTRSSQGKAIYHTNVLMSVGKDYVVACVESIVKPDRAAFVASVEHSGKTLIDITLQQMEQSYCGNILELSNGVGERVLLLSEKAWAGFTVEQQAFFNQRMEICANDINTIETIGGGSMRCMLAEVFNPPT